ncbi:TetR/AcrR family transcriptional regulator [Rhodococcus aerolatus]
MTVAVARRTARQTQLLDELVALVLAEGFADLTLDDVAARLRCSKSTLYAVARSREQLVREAVVAFFAASTAAVEAAVLEVSGPGAGTHRERVAAYLRAVATALRPASPAFVADLASFAPAREVYERNTTAAAARVRQLVDDGVAAGEFRAVHAAFVADVVAATMVRIQQRQVAAATGLDDAAAYDELADLVLHAVTA